MIKDRQESDKGPNFFLIEDDSRGVCRVCCIKDLGMLPPPHNVDIFTKEPGSKGWGNSV
jgi:hypothetical protein